MKQALLNTSWYLMVIPVGLSLAHYFGIYGHEHYKRFSGLIRSFAAGFSIAYVFLILFPDLPSFGDNVHVNTSMLTLIGFALFHGAHKWVFQASSKSKQALLSDEIHLITAASYSFLISFSLVELLRSEPSQGMLMALVIIIHTLLSEISQVDVGKSYIDQFTTPILVIVTMFGGLLPLFGWINRSLTVTLFSITAGAIIYIAIREELPDDSHGKPSLFFLGVASLILIQWVFIG